MLKSKDAFYKCIFMFLFFSFVIKVYAIISYDDFKNRVNSLKPDAELIGYVGFTEEEMR